MICIPKTPTTSARSMHETSQRCSRIVAAKILHETSSQLRAPLNFVYLSDVRTALQGQVELLATLERYGEQMRNLHVQDNEWVRQRSVPRYVQPAVQCVKKLRSDKSQAARDQLGKLRVERRPSLLSFLRLYVWRC